MEFGLLIEVGHLTHSVGCRPQAGDPKSYLNTSWPTSQLAIIILGFLFYLGLCGVSSFIRGNVMWSKAMSCDDSKQSFYIPNTIG